jgi:hypothetical protein
MTHGPTPESISDETLMRFVDGDLSPDEQSLVAAEIARNPDLTKRVDAFRFTREELPGAYVSTLRVPPQLMERFLCAAGPAPNDTKPRLTARSVLERLNLRRQVMALAACAALLLAGASGWLLRDSLRPDYAGLVAPPSLQRALDETPSHESAKLAADLSIRLTSTFGSLQRRWCREYNMLYANRVQASALACRGADGIWRVEILEDLSDPSQPSTDPNAIRPAGEDREQHGRKTESVAEYRDRIMAADVSLQDEAKLITEHWKRTP